MFKRRLLNHFLSPNIGSRSLIPRASTATIPIHHCRQQRCQLSNQPEGSKTALIVGSSGSLGATIANRLKKHHDCIVIGTDIHPPSQERANSIDGFIELPIDSTDERKISIDGLHHNLREGLRNLYNDNDDEIELDAIVVASGGFSMDEDDQFTIGEVYENMLQMNYYPVIAAGEIAKKYMTSTNQGLFVMIGAMSALSPAPGMIAYSSSKAAAQYYIQTMGAMTGRALQKEHKISRESQMGYDLRRKHPSLDSMTALGILPIMLDTKSNRDALPKEDFSQWTKPMDIAKEIGSWVDMPALRPHSGSLVKVLTKDGETQFVLAR